MPFTAANLPVWGASEHQRREIQHAAVLKITILAHVRTIKTGLCRASLITVSGCIHRATPLESCSALVMPPIPPGSKKMNNNSEIHNCRARIRMPSPVCTCVMTSICCGPSTTNIGSNRIKTTSRRDKTTWTPVACSSWARVATCISPASISS